MTTVQREVWVPGPDGVPVLDLVETVTTTDLPDDAGHVDRDAIRVQAVDAATERLSHTTLAVSTRAAVADAIGVVADVILDAVLPTEGL